MSLSLAEQLSTEIISADSRQVYKELTIGTAKPTSQELASIKHHFIDHCSIQQHFAANHFEKEGLEIVDQLHKQQKTPIIVGGTGLYIDALLVGLDEFPAIENTALDKINKQLSEANLDELLAILKDKDPKYYQQVDRQNRRRIERALQVILHVDKPYSSYLNKKKTTRNFETIHLILEMDRTQLYDRINLRVDQMIENGLEEEVFSLKNNKHLKALDTVGYREFFQYFDGDFSYEHCIEKIKTNTRRYAKRQMTWLRRYEHAHRFNANNQSRMIEYIQSELA